MLAGRNFDYLFGNPLTVSSKQQNTWKWSVVKAFQKAFKNTITASAQEGTYIVFKNRFANKLYDFVRLIFYLKSLSKAASI